MKIKRENATYKYDASVKRLSEVLLEYSVLDVAFSLLITSLWLPNIASEVKQQLLYSIFLSTMLDSFSTQDKILSYSDFRLFFDKIANLLPEFPGIEDYVPETDWGDVKFHHNDWDYRIFYGSDIENVYDYLMLFQVLYSSRDEEYLTLEFRSPAQELQACLSLQDEIISGITTQPQGEKLDINSGDFKVPPENYWKQSLEFFQTFNF